MWETVRFSRYTTKYKIVDTNDQHIKKVLWIVLSRNATKKGIFLVRDNYVVKYVNGNKSYNRMVRVLLKFKESIHSKNLGELFKKYDVPPSIRKIALKSRSVHQTCLLYSVLIKFLVAPERFIELTKYIPPHNLVWILLKKKSLSNFMFSMSEKRRVDALRYRFIYDIVLMYEKVSHVINEFNFNRDMEEVHDHLVELVKSIENEKQNLPFEYNEKTLKKFGAVKISDNITIDLPKSGVDLVVWGEHLSHCIGSYVDIAKRGNRIFMGVFVDNKELPDYTIEMYQSRVVQFYGRRNCLPPKDIEEKVVSYISST